MGCEKCEEIQHLAFNDSFASSTPICYVRVGVANIAIVGCEKHLKETTEKLRK